MPIIDEFEKELHRNSAHTYGRWHVVDLHNHSPVSHDFQGDRAAALDEAAKHLQQTDVDIVMFTDHQELPDRQFTDDVARRSGKTVLRGAEFNIFVDAWAKPAGKIEKNLFFHLLAGFDPEGQQDPDYWFAHLCKTCVQETRDIGGTNVRGFTASVDAVCDVLDEAGAIVIPAHLHTEKDPFRSRSVDDIYTDNEFLRLARHRFTALEVTDLATAEFFDGEHEETDHLLKTCIRSSDAHVVASIGNRVSYVQMERPCFAELKAGLQMPFRVSLTPPTEPESFVVGLNIRGQFFPDMWLSLSPHCNAFIGVKGSGKTSVLECLRFALGAPVPDSRLEGVKAHLQSILGVAGSVRVLIKRKDGAKILVERSAASPNEFQLTFDDDRQSIVQNPEALMFASYILGWHEIEQAATDPNIRQVYLDTIAGREQIRQQQEIADAKANQVQYLHGQVTSRYSTFRSLHEQIARLEDLRSGLQDLTDANLIDLQTKYEVAVRQNEAIEELKHKLRDGSTNIEARAEAFTVQAELSAFEGDSPVGEFALAARDALVGLKTDVDGFVKAQRTKLQKVAEELDARAPELEKAFTEFTQAYANSLSKLSPEQQRLLETHRQVMDDTRALPRLKSEMAAEKAEIEALLSDLVTVCNDVANALDAQTELREQKISELNDQLLSFGVNLKVAPLARRTVFDELAGRFATGANIFNELNSFASGERRHHRRLARAYESLRNDLLGGFTVFFHSAEFTSYLGAFEGDDLQIAFDVGKPGEQYSPIDQLSAGQRCTAVFPLLLKMREGPLIVDQPEDNLDNRHIADVIAPALLQDKKARQIAFTSHNANLVVLTDSEQIVMFEASGSEGSVHERGYLCTSRSAITPEVIAILDGGQRALELRYQKYGITEA